MDPFLAQFAKQQQPGPADHNLLGMAKQNGLRITDGFATSGHNAGSNHYKGSKTDPAAIDVDPAAMTPAKRRQLESQGYRVVDETHRPKGQAVWTGAHYHIEKGQGQPAHSDPFLAQFAQQSPSSNIASRTMALMDRPKFVAPPIINPIQNAFNAAINTGSAGIVNLPTRPGISKEVGSFAGPALGTGAAILAAPETGFASMAIPAAYMGAVGAGNTAREQVERTGRIDNPVAVGTAGLTNAIAGAVGPVGKGLKLVPRVLANAGLNAGLNAGQDVIQQAAEQRTLTPNIDANRTMQSAAIGGGLGGALGAFHKGKAEAPKPQPKELPSIIHIPTPEQVKTDWTAPPPTPRELSQGFRERGGIITTDAPKGNVDVQILGADGRPAPQTKSNINKTPYEIALERTREVSKPEAPPQIIIDRGSGGPRKEVEIGGLPNHTNPLTGKPYETVGTGARESAEALSSHMDDAHTAEQMRNEAVNNLRAKEKALLEAGGSADAAEAQRSIGSRINELEGKAREGTIAEHESVELQQKRAVLDEVLQARKAAKDAESLLGETQAPTKRSTLPAPEPQTREIGTPEPTKGLPTAQELALRRADAIAQTTKELPSVDTPKPARLPDNPASVIQRPEPREVGSILDAQGNPIKRGTEAPVIERVGQSKPTERPALELPESYNKPQPKEVGTVARAADSVPAEQVSKNVHKLPEGGEVFTHGRDAADIQAQVAAHKGQIANIADIERHLQDHNPEGVEGIRNILNAGKNSEAVQFSYSAREAPGEPLRKRDNFVPTHFTYETIKPSTQRAFLRRKYGSDDAVISHLKQEIVNKGGRLDASLLQTKGGKDIAQAAQIGKLITALNEQTGGAYLKSPRVHGINLGETTRSAAGDRGIRLDTISESSLTGRKVKPEQLQGHSYNNQIAPALKALNDLAETQGSPVFKRAVKQIQKGEISGKTMRELKAELANKDLAAKFCNAFGMKP